MRETAFWLSLLGVILACATGCSVQVDKSHDGESDHVKIATPFGGISVNKGEPSPEELGLPAYPGAALDQGSDGNKSARVDLGFGDWKLRVKIGHYATSDSRDQVLAFYRKALSEYGTVIECAGNKAVAEPVATGEGLRCDSDDHSSTQAHVHGDLQLKAGSPRHQHIVALDRGGGSVNHFSLIALDLPHGVNDEQQGTN
jgi:hypothetical protein